MAPITASADWNRRWGFFSSNPPTICANASGMPAFGAATSTDSDARETCALSTSNELCRSPYMRWPVSMWNATAPNE